MKLSSATDSKRARILISCGEASGDLYAAELVEALRSRVPSIEAFGLGGERARAAGVDSLVRLEEISVIGLFEVIRKLPALFGAMRKLCDAAVERRPDVAVLIDFSGFHLRLAKRLRALRIPVVYYVSPQVWAWRRGRVRTIRKRVDRMLVILPFEKELYEKEKVPVRYVGHPLVDLVKATADRESFCRRLGLDAKRPVITLLPGSRRREVEIHVPVLATAVEELSRRRPELQFVMSRASSVPVEDMNDLLGGSVALVHILNGSVYDGLAHAEAAVVASGTATVEAALLAAPMVVIYRIGWPSYVVGRPFVRVPFYSMVNLVSGRGLVSELIQDGFTASNVVAEVLRLLDPETALEMRRGLGEVKERLGGGGASGRAAEAVLEYFEL